MIKHRILLWKQIPDYLKPFKEKYKEHLHDYIYVYIFDTKEEMYDYMDKYKAIFKGEYCEHNYSAITQSYTMFKYDSNNNLKYKNDYGFILFHKKCFYGREISHEVSHTILNYFDNVITEKRDLFGDHNEDYSIYVPNNHDLEELFCYMSGEVNNSINRIYWEELDKQEKRDN